MIHKKEWATCDRCGAKIEEMPRGAGNTPKLRRKLCKPEELKVLKADRYGYISNTELINPEIVSVEIVEYYSEKQNTIHLCGKCRKEFERFMKNE